MSGRASAEAVKDEPIFLSGMSALSARYDGFILDQWGVLHDGAVPYDGAVDCLRRLRAAGKHIVILSNSGRRDAYNVRLMDEMGFVPALYDRFVGAGEDARTALSARSNPFHRALGSRCYAFTRDGDRSLFDGIGIEFVERVADAQFLAVIGIDSPRRNLIDYEAELAAGIARDLPMICANPDLLRPAGREMVQASGVLAQRYEALKGRVFYHGKPHPAIYGSCLEALGACAGQRVIAIGDSIEHDILGAARAGIECALVAGGVHRAELGVRWGEAPTPAQWQAFAAEAVALPRFVLPAFVW